MFVSLVSHESGPAGLGAPAMPAASAGDVQAFQSMMSSSGSAQDGVPAVLGDFAHSLSDKFAAWRNDWAQMGRLDLSDHASAVRAIEQQARVSMHSVEFQFALQSADSVRHAFKTLYQQQA
jgi:hypothetical protein